MSSLNPSDSRDRLESLILMPPATGTLWTGAPVQTSVTTIKRADGTQVNLDCPLFWYDPPWHLTDTESADVIAKTVAQYGIVVSALRRDLAGPESNPSFHVMHVSGSLATDSKSHCDLRRLPRMIPYRPERYGLSDADFDDAMIVDVRLTIARDETGRFAYSPQQIQRWEATPDDNPLAGGGWVPAATFPPDVPSIEQLHSKLDQLRVLSPSAAVFVSMSPYRLDQELPIVIKQQPDGVILRFDDVKLSGLALAALTRRARQWMKHEGVPNMPLWIVPGEISVDDASKLVALGASGVAIDHWCNPIVEQAQDATDHSKAARMGFKSMRSTQDPVLVNLVHYHLEDAIGRFQGLAHSLAHLPPDEALATLDAAWAKALGIRFVSFGIQPA